MPEKVDTLMMDSKRVYFLVAKKDRATWAINVSCAFLTEGNLPYAIGICLRFVEISKLDTPKFNPFTVFKAKESVKGVEFFRGQKTYFEVIKLPCTPEEFVQEFKKSNFTKTLTDWIHEVIKLSEAFILVTDLQLELIVSTDVDAIPVKGKFVLPKG